MFFLHFILQCVLNRHSHSHSASFAEQVVNICLHVAMRYIKLQNTMFKVLLYVSITMVFILFQCVYNLKRQKLQKQIAG